MAKRKRSASAASGRAGGNAGDTQSAASSHGTEGSGSRISAAASGRAAADTAPGTSTLASALARLANLPAGTDRLSTMVSLAAAALSGVMIFLATADFDIWPLAYVAMLPSLWVTLKAPTRRRAWLYGWVTGTVTNAGGFYWITGLLVRFAQFPLPLAVLGLLLLSAYQGLVFMLFSLAIRRIRELGIARWSRPLPMVVLAPVVMVGFEMLVPMLFPWYLAITQAWVIPVIQIAELTGPVGVTAMLMAVNGALYDLATQPTWRRRLACAAGGAGVAAAVLVFGLVRMADIDAQRAAAPELSVGVVQGNIGFSEKGLDNPALATKQLTDLQAESAELEKRGAELIMWTESAFPYLLPRTPENTMGNLSPEVVRDGFSAPILFGAATRVRNDPDAYPYNSAVLLDEKGQMHGPYDKIFLLMFGEYIPGLETFPFLRTIMPRAAGHFARGERIMTFPFEHEGQQYRLGPLICYEDIIPDFGRKLAKLHPHLLVNITNDAWFGDTSEPWQHLALSVFRAVEVRTDLIRAVNTGVSAFIDANGRVYAKSYAVDPHITPVGVDSLLGRAVLMEGGHTFYARFGDIFGYLCVAATLGMWLVWPRLATRRRTRGQGSSRSS